MQVFCFWFFSVRFAKFLRTSFLQNTTRRLLLFMAIFLVVKKEWAKETVNYDTKIKAYQFELEVWVIKKGRLGERTNLTRVFEESVWNKVWCDFHRHTIKSTENQYLLQRKSTPHWRRRFLSFCILLNLSLILKYDEMVFLRNICSQCFL